MGFGSQLGVGLATIVATGVVYLGSNSYTGIGPVYALEIIVLSFWLVYILPSKNSFTARGRNIRASTVAPLCGGIIITWRCTRHGHNCAASQMYIASKSLKTPIGHANLFVADSSVKNIFNGSVLIPNPHLEKEITSF